MTEKIKSISPLPTSDPTSDSRLGPEPSETPKKLEEETSTTPGKPNGGPAGDLGGI